MISKNSRIRIITLLVLWAAALLLDLPLSFSISAAHGGQALGVRGYAGSSSCRECHEQFYQLWSTSFHGLAMQPYTDALARERLTPQKEDLVIGEFRFRAEIDNRQGWVMEKGPDGIRKYRIEHVLGGKNIFYFLTPMDRGRLQTLPLAYDVNAKAWIDMAGSGVRHFPGERQTDEPLNWKEWPYTFNTACYGCHVSQLSTNYDPETDTYHTTWSEPGINCETCHGPSAEHNEVFRGISKGQPPPADPKILSTKTMTKEQRNDLCASCHAKATAPLTGSYPPGGRFFDYFDLVALEDSDYYPDGRDLGENYTITSWRMSPCVKSGRLDCLHCHTSSGRYRFKNAEAANNACLPCHEDRVKNATSHTRHQEGSAGNRCISCHMPMTSFARMKRSDHSMLPPTPSATLAYQSPNACNLCHADKDAAWADTQVRAWRTRDYQAALLYRASLVDEARKRDWRRYEEMLGYITSQNREEVFAASLIRLIPSSLNPKLSRALLKAAADSSPLIRAAAIQALSTIPSQESLQALIKATGDATRLVRIRAAAALAGHPEFRGEGSLAQNVQKATQEFLESLLVWPDHWASHYNLGNYHLNGAEPGKAIVAYDRALKFEPRAVMVMVNAAIAHARMGQIDKAEASLDRAIQTAPTNAAALFNMGLLQAERNDPGKAERYLRDALQYDPQMAQAAYNLCVLLSKNRPGEAVDFCREAYTLRPEDPKIAYTLAYMLHQQGETGEAIAILRIILGKYPGYGDAQMFLGHISASVRKSEKGSDPDLSP